MPAGRGAHRTRAGHRGRTGGGRLRPRTTILAAAFELIGEVGYAGLTIEGIAARVGCGKQTIYRWWRSKADVLLDALSAKGDRLAGHRQVTDILRTLMAEARIDAEFGERFRTGFLERRRGAPSDGRVGWV